MTIGTFPHYILAVGYTYSRGPIVGNSQNLTIGIKCIDTYINEIIFFGGLSVERLLKGKREAHFFVYSSLLHTHLKLFFSYVKIFKKNYFHNTVSDHEKSMFT